MVRLIQSEWLCSEVSWGQRTVVVIVSRCSSETQEVIMEKLWVLAIRK